MTEDSLAEEMNRINVSVPDKEGIELPSTVTDRYQIFMPKLNHDKSEFNPEIYGKWMWFSNGDLQLQDQIWINLQPLLENKTVLLLESSTARKSGQGVVKCYTCEDKDHIMCAGLAVQSIINEDFLLFYKTVQATKDGLYRRCFDRFITKYMLTVSGKFYERDYFDRWKMVTNDNGAQEKNVASSRETYLPPLKKKQYLDSEMMPSEESKKTRYIYSTCKDILEPVGLWHLFCNVTDFDANCMTELDRVWMKVKTLYNEGIFLGVSTETNAYFYQSGDANYLRRTISCSIRDYRDIANVRETGLKLLERTDYSYPIYLKTLRQGDFRQKSKFHLRYLLTEDGELYNYTEEQWKLVKDTR